MKGALYDLLLRPIENFGLRRLRSKLLKLSSGKTLELGAGTGLNLLHYPSTVELVASEPDPEMIRVAAEKHADCPVKWIQSSAETLPLASGSFDTVVATLVFCTVPDVEAGLTEAYRVLKPGGKMLLIEHVRPRNPILAVVSDALTPLWKCVAGGCHLNRNPFQALMSVGFHLIAQDEFWRGIGRIWILQKPAPVIAEPVIAAHAID